jgi:hypothetical protein
MRVAAAGALSAVVAFSPGCGSAPQDRTLSSDPVRRATFHSLAARDYLFGCPGGATRAETQAQVARMNELYRFAIQKGAEESLALAQGEWETLSPHDTQPPCAAGEVPYRTALAGFSARLDELAGAIRQVPQ